MPGYKIISSDSHVFEPPDLWTGRIDPEFRDRAPYVMREGENDQWYVEVDQKLGAFGLVSQVGVRFENPENITFEGSFDNLRPGGYDPHEHVKDLEIDGVYADVLYPSIGLFLFKVPDTRLVSAMFRTYNDWLAEFCSAYPSRLKGIAMVNVDDVEEGIEELQRTRKMGLAGAMISVYPQADKQYDLPRYEPLWAAAQDLDMPLSLHTATQRPGDQQHSADFTTQSATFRANIDYWVRCSLSNIILTGVFERYPKLKVAAVEFELAWVPYFLRMLDYVYVERQMQASYRFKGNILPSDHFHSNVYMSFQEDELGIQMRHIIGVDNLMWGSDYPHAESTWPKSQETLERILAGVPEEERARIAGANAAKLYDFD